MRALEKQVYSENCESGSGFKVNKEPGIWNRIWKRGSGSWEVWVGGIGKEIIFFFGGGGGAFYQIVELLSSVFLKKETYYYNWMNVIKLQFTLTLFLVELRALWFGEIVWKVINNFEMPCLIEYLFQVFPNHFPQINCRHAKTWVVYTCGNFFSERIRELAS